MCKSFLAPLSSLMVSLVIIKAFWRLSMAEDLSVPARKRKRSQGQMLRDYGHGLGKGTVQAHRFEASMQHSTAGVFRVRKHVTEYWYEAYLLAMETEGRPKGLFLLLGLEDEDEPYWIAFDDRFVTTNWGEAGWSGAKQSAYQKKQVDAWFSSGQGEL